MKKTLLWAKVECHQMTKQKQGAVSSTPTGPVSSCDTRIDRWPYMKVVNDGAACLISVQAKPNSRSSTIVDISAESESVVVQLQAPAKEGEANAELIAFFSRIFKIAKRDITLEFGSKSRHKVVRVCCRNKTPKEIDHAMKIDYESNKT